MFTTGVSGDMALIMTSFVSRVERSDTAAPSIENCKSIVDRKVTSSKPRTFGRFDKEYLHPEVKLPKYRYDRKSGQ